MTLGLQQAAVSTAQVTEAAGQLARAAQPLAQQVNSAYKLAIDRLRTQAGIVGGNEHGLGFFGGDDAEDPMKDIKAYRFSLASKAKEDTIRGLARALKRAGVDVDPEGSLDDIVSQLKDKIPDPRKGTTFVQDAVRQEKLCRTIARVLNDEFNRTGDARDNLIDMSGSAKDICWQVAEYVHSFVTGLHSEFLEVHASVRRVLRNLKVLGEVMRRSYDGITVKLADQGSSELKRDTEGLDDIYRRARAAQLEQERVLENFLHATLAPAEKELEIALRDESEAHQLIRKWIVASPGSAEVSDSIALSTAGIVSLTAIAARVEKALKQIGLGVQDYLDSADMQGLQKLLDGKMAVVDPEKMGEFLTAVNTLRESFYRRDEISGSLGGQRRAGMATTFDDEELEFGGNELERGGGGNELERGSGGGNGLGRGSDELERGSGGGNEPGRGGLDDDNDVLGGDGKADETALDRRVKKRKAERKLILKEFVSRSAKAFDQLLSAVEEVGPLLGTKIPLSDKLEELRNDLARLKDLKVAKIEMALLGFWAEAQARERRDQFLNALRAVVADLDDLMALEMYSSASRYFARMREAMASLDRVIEQFAEVVRKKWGGREEEVQMDETDETDETEAARGGDEDGFTRLSRRHGSSSRDGDEDGFTRGGDEDGFTRGGDEDDFTPAFARSQWDLLSSINSFLYFYYIAKIRTNLSQTGKELKFYGEKYGNVLGDAIAGRLRALQSERDAKKLSVSTGGVANQTKEQFATQLSAGINTFASDAEAIKAIDTAISFIEAQYSCKVKFYRALEALDLYMKAFTDAIVNNPDDAKDIKRMLDGTQVIARWFTEETGDALAGAFELMPTWGWAGAAPIAPADDAVSNLDPLTADGAHYYTLIDAGHRAGAPVGVPVFGLSPGATVGVDANAPNRVGAVKAAVRKVTDNFQALKNLMNAFARIGDKFGGAELRRKIHMSPTQIYKALLEHIRSSALSVGIKRTAAAVHAATGVPITVPTIRLRGSAQVPPIQFGGQDITPLIPAGRQRVVPLEWAAIPGAAELLVFFGSVRTDPDGDTLGGDFVREDRFFTFMIKAVAAKIMTVVGVFDLFNRPSPVYDLTPTRMVIGGAGFDAPPEIVNEAMELYFRLPRLAEFYRGMLSFDTTAGTDLQIALLPDLEGAFSGLIRQVYIRADEALEGDYSDSEVRDLVRECNSIYAHYREKHGAETAVQASIMGLVSEVNRRFGVVKKDQWEKYAKLMQESRRSGSFGDVNTTNYAILPGEEEWEPDRLGPSGAFMGPGDPAAAGDVKLRGGKFKLDPTDGTSWVYWTLLQEFRQKYDALFASEDVKSQFTSVSYGTLIRQAQLEASRTTSDEGKLAIATRLIQGSSSLASTDVNKAFMFHETVVLGLNTLAAIFTLLESFKFRLESLDIELMETAILETIRAQAAAGGNVNRAHVVATLTAWDRAAAAYYILRGDDTAVAPDGVLLRARGGAPLATVTTNCVYAIAYAGAQGVGAGAANLAEATGQRMLVDRQRVMLDLLTNLFELTGGLQGLVKLSFPSSGAAQISIDFSGVRSLVENLTADVRHFMDIFRPHMDRGVIKKYENAKDDDGGPNYGSLYWVEEHLLDGMVRGLTDAGGRVLAGQTTLEQLSRKANQIFLNLTKRETAIGTGLIEMGAAGAPGMAVAAVVGEAGDDNAYEQYGSVFAQLVFYDSTRSHAGVAGAAATRPNYDYSSMGVLMRTARPSAAVHNHVMANAAPVGRFGGLYTAGRFTAAQTNGLVPARSLMFFFNQCIAQYLEQFYDVSSGKIYQQLFSAFANGAFSQQVMLSQQGYGAPDLTAVGGGWLRRGDPKPGGVLLQSLGIIMQRLMRDISPNTQVSDHLTSTLSEVPLYMKESYRAHLPAFSKLFELANAKGEMLKLVLQRTRIKVGRPGMALLVGVATGAGGGAPVAESANPGNYSVAMLDDISAFRPVSHNTFITPPIHAIHDLTVDYTHVGVAQRTTAIINSINMGAYAMVSAITEVMRELADSPVYYQTQENSIDSYRTRYDRLPLMPLSLAAVVLRDVVVANDQMIDQRFLPIHGVGSSQFKTLYGTRQLLGQPKVRIGWEQLPGVRANLSAYNGLVTKREQLSEAKYKSFVDREITALRFLFDARNYRGLMSVPLWTMATAQLTGLTMGIDTRLGALGNSIYSLRGAAQLETSLDVVETSDQTGKITDISDLVGGAAASTQLGKNRANERIFNIIDLNIIPLNIHALMREVPLANTYNYAYTFDQMASLMFDTTAEQVTQIQLAGPAPLVAPQRYPQTTREVFLKLLLNPYNTTSMKTYGSDLHRHGTAGFVHRIFRGNDNLGMGRPKFLSDQLFNKALFGSLFTSPYRYDEAGPGAMPGHFGEEAAVGDMRTALAAAPRGESIPIGEGVGHIRWPEQDHGPWPALHPATVRSNILTYMKRARGAADNPRQVYVVDVASQANSLRLEEVGRERWDTRLVRNLFFVTNVLRLMRLKLNRELTQVRTVLTSSHSAVAPSITEYGSTSFGPNEQFNDTGSGYYLADREDIART